MCLSIYDLLRTITNLTSPESRSTQNEKYHFYYSQSMHLPRSSPPKATTRRFLEEVHIIFSRGGISLCSPTVPCCPIILHRFLHERICRNGARASYLSSVELACSGENKKKWQWNRLCRPSFCSYKLYWDRTRPLDAHSTWFGTLRVGEGVCVWTRQKLLVT